LERGHDADLLLIGREAELPDLLSEIEPGIRRRIRYEGFQAPGSLPRFFAQADIFVLPSRHDGWGVVVNQAMAAGLPIIASDAVGAASDLIEEGKSGFVVPAGDVERLQEAMGRILGLPADTRAEFGERARRKARGLQPENGAKQWVEVFDAIAHSELRAG
jgi:glycosyltransferase involved in cell wall biosynthesis